MKLMYILFILSLKRSYGNLQRNSGRAEGVAHVLEILGVKLRMAPNRIDRIVRKHPCPPSKIAELSQQSTSLKERSLAREEEQ
jgi:hypothetical protein